MSTFSTGFLERMQQGISDRSRCSGGGGLRGGGADSAAGAATSTRAPGSAAAAAAVAGGRPFFGNVKELIRSRRSCSICFNNEAPQTHHQTTDLLQCNAIRGAMTAFGSLQGAREVILPSDK